MKRNVIKNKEIPQFEKDNICEKYIKSNINTKQTQGIKKRKRKRCKFKKLKS